METEVSLILRDVPYVKRGSCVGVERGALAILAQGDKLSLALGDFDSVTAEEFAAAEQLVTEKFSTEKWLHHIP